jgi:hypothetical protein
MKKLLLPLLSLGLASALHAADPLTVELWPTGAPEPAGFKIEAEKELPKKTPDDVKRVTNVTVPTPDRLQARKPQRHRRPRLPGGRLQHSGH